MKTAWDRYVKQQLKTPVVRKAYEEEAKVLGISLRRATSRMRVER